MNVASGPGQVSGLRVMHAGHGSRFVPRAWIACVLLGAVALPGMTVTALAGTPEQDAAELGRNHFYVKSLKRGWRPLTADAKATLAALRAQEPAVPAAQALPVVKQRDVIYMDWAERLGAAGDTTAEDEAYLLLDVLDTDAADASTRDTANQRCLAVDLARGRRTRATDSEAAIGHFFKASERDPTNAEPLNEVGGIGEQLSRGRMGEQRFGLAIDSLDEYIKRIEGRRPAADEAIGKLEAVRKEIFDTTGTVAIAWLGSDATLDAVQGSKTDYRNATLTFAPQDGSAAPPPVTVTDPTIRVLADRIYTVTAKGDGGQFALPGGVSVSTGGVEVVLPRLVPANMMLVPAGPGIDAFFIDRTEVSVAQFRPYAQGSRASFGGGPDNHPAAGVEFSHARGYASSVGKQLPSKEQWLHAAFGSPSGRGSRYPWGDSAGNEGTHYFGSAFGPVTGCAAGASTFSRCLNMAGNAWEWLADETALGMFARGAFEADVSTDTDSWRADFLRSPMPSYRKWESSSDAAWQTRHQYYAVKSAGSKAKMGLRCVVPLGKPSR